MKILFSCFVLLLSVAAANNIAHAQTETANGVEVDKDIALLRRNIRAEKKKLIAANVTLTETEATKFWPVYDQYVVEMTKHYDDFFSLIKDYAANQKTLSDDKASNLIKRWAEIQIELAQTRQKYIPAFEKVIPATKVARFFQIDRRLYLLNDLQVTSEIPLIVN
jgi:hypothetical protein